RSSTANANMPFRRSTASSPHSAYASRTTSESVRERKRCPSASSSALSSRKLYVSPLYVSVWVPSAVVMGWSPAVLRSMIERRRCPKATDSYTQKPSPSGPRCSSASVMRRTMTGDAGRRSAHTMPVMPHMKASSGPGGPVGRRGVVEHDVVAVSAHPAEYDGGCPADDRGAGERAVHEAVGRDDALRSQLHAGRHDRLGADVAAVADSRGRGAAVGPSTRQRPHHRVVRVDVHAGRDRAVRPDLDPAAASVEQGVGPDPGLLAGLNLSVHEGAVVDARAIAEPEP